MLNLRYSIDKMGGAKSGISTHSIALGGYEVGVLRPGWRACPQFIGVLVPNLLADIPTRKFFNGTFADARENESINVE